VPQDAVLPLRAVVVRSYEWKQISLVNCGVLVGGGVGGFV